jgi:hypothetical protein
MLHCEGCAGSLVRDGRRKKAMDASAATAIT